LHTLSPHSFPTRRSSDLTVTRSGGPGELGLRESCLALVLDAKSIDLRALGFGHREVRPDGVEHSVEANRPAALDAEGHDVLYLEDRKSTRLNSSHLGISY